MAGLNGSLEYALDGHGLKPIGCMVIKIRHHEEGFEDLSDKKTNKIEMPGQDFCRVKGGYCNRDLETHYCNGS